MYANRLADGLGALGYLQPTDPGYYQQPIPTYTTPGGRVVPFFKLEDVNTNALGPWGPPAPLAASGSLPLSTALDRYRDLQRAGFLAGLFQYGGTWYRNYQAAELEALEAEGILYDDRNVAAAQQAVQQQQQQTAEAALRAPLDQEAVRRGLDPADYATWRTDELRNFLCTGNLQTTCPYLTPWVPIDPNPDPLLPPPVTGNGPPPPAPPPFDTDMVVTERLAPEPGAPTGPGGPGDAVRRLFAGADNGGGPGVPGGALLPLVALAVGALILTSKDRGRA